MAKTRVVLDQKGLYAVLQGAQGPVVRDTVQRTQRVLNRARQLCPVDTGNLRGSLSSEMVKATNGDVVGRVGTNVPYAVFVHEGTKKMAGRPFLKDALSAANS